MNHQQENSEIGKQTDQNRSGCFLRRVRFGVALMMMGAFVTALYWAQAREAYRRMDFSLKLADGGKVTGMVVLPKTEKIAPIILYLHGSGGSVLNSGRELRQLAELGFATVDFDYDQDNQASFDAQFVAVCDHLARQPWADTNKVVWMGFSLGAERLLSFVLRHPEQAPRLIVRMAGGWVAELDVLVESNRPISRSGLTNSAFLLVHGQKDQTFPATECERLQEWLRVRHISVNANILPNLKHNFGAEKSTVVRAIGEYCAEFLQTTVRVRTNRIPSKWYYWIPLCIGLGICGIGWLVQWRYRVAETVDPWPKASRALAVMAIVLAAAAFWETGFRLGMPFLQLSESTRNLTRRWIIQNSQRADFDYLTGLPIWEHAHLNTILQHVELANFRRSFLYVKLDERIFDEYILSPVIDNASLAELHWRRDLWENFYPRVRRASNPAAAAEIVVRFLRERVGISPKYAKNVGIETIWGEQCTDAVGFERIYVAALRSVGVAARLNSDHQAEMWTGAIWTNAPRPVVTYWNAESKANKTAAKIGFKDLSISAAIRDFRERAQLIDLFPKPSFMSEYMKAAGFPFDMNRRKSCVQLSNR